MLGSSGIVLKWKAFERDDERIQGDTEISYDQNEYLIELGNEGVYHNSEILKILATTSNIWRELCFCRYCSKRGEDLTIDHVQAASRGGGWEWENLVKFRSRICDHFCITSTTEYYSCEHQSVL